MEHFSCMVTSREWQKEGDRSKCWMGSTEVGHPRVRNVCKGALRRTEAYRLRLDNTNLWSLKVGTIEGKAKKRRK